MEYVQSTTEYVCGVDLHSNKMYLCIKDRQGTVKHHQNHNCSKEELLKVLAPYRPDISVAVESTYNWYWMGDCCHDASIPFYLGHALYMKAIWAAKKKNDRRDSSMINDLLRNGMFPPAYAYPKEMRSTRNLMRQRLRYVRTRGSEAAFLEIFCVQNGIPSISRILKKKKTRHELIEEFSDPDERLTVKSKLAHIDFLDTIITTLEKQAHQQAKSHDSQALALLLAIPGIGPILGLTLLYEIHTIDRFKTHQKFASYCRVVKCAKESNGKSTGSSGQKIGNAYLRWALGEVVVHACQRSAKVQKAKQRLESKHGKAKSLSIMAHRFAVAIYYVLKRKEPFKLEAFMN